eukprot:scaffold12500_cov154-Amphora_coffeaeformis.AAC.1
MKAAGFGTEGIGFQTTNSVVAERGIARVATEGTGFQTTSSVATRVGMLTAAGFETVANVGT